MRGSWATQLAVAPLLAAIALAGCSAPDDPEFDLGRPASRVVAVAAGSTLELEPAGIAFEARSPEGGHRATGLIEAHNGRFRVEARGEPSLGTTGTLVAVGMPEGGNQVTLREEYTRYEGEPQRCWMGAHAPVGGNRATASVQEAVHLITAALEGMRQGPERAMKIESEEGNGHRYAVTLERTRAGTVNKESFYREASLSQNLAGPVRVTISAEGIITGLEFQLRDYRPIFGWEAKKLSPRPVSIEAKINRTEDELDLTPAPCSGTE
jgi:hypothetical protein